MRDLFDSTSLNGVKLKNRFVRSGTWEQMASADGRLTDRLFSVYENLARGQVGLIITSYTFVTRGEQPNPGMLGIYDDRGHDDYRALTEMVHKHGSAIAMQLVYGGTQTFLPQSGQTIFGPSAVAEMATGVVAKEMEQSEIRALVKAFGDAAVRAKKAGFDGVQIHCAHGYFLGQWLNPHHNRRTDEYGGSIENRGRIIFETYEEVRSRCGEDYLIMLKINSEDYVPGGATFDDCRYVCMELARRGIDAIEISGGIFAAEESQRWARPHVATAEDEAYFAAYAAQVAEEVETPVILVGGLKSLEVMERLLAETKIEYFSMARALMTEPEIIQRWMQGDRSKSKCISCNQCRHPEGNICILNRQT